MSTITIFNVTDQTIPIDQLPYADSHIIEGPFLFSLDSASLESVLHRTRKMLDSVVKLEGWNLLNSAYIIGTVNAKSFAAVLFIYSALINAGAPQPHIWIATESKGLYIGTAQFQAQAVDWALARMIDLRNQQLIQRMEANDGECPA